MSDHSKTVPVFHAARIARDGTLPESIHFILPQLGALRTTTNRVPGKVYLEDYFPVGDEHHTILGKYLDSWSHAETAIAEMFHGVLRAERRQAYLLCRAMNQRMIHDALFELGTQRFTDEGISHLERVIALIRAANQKRNVIVHGAWVIEVAMFGRRGTTQFKVRLLREITPQDHRTGFELVNLRNQRDRLRYCYDLKRIQAASREAMGLSAAIKVFRDQIASYEKQPSGSWRLSGFLEQLGQSLRLVY